MCHKFLTFSFGPQINFIIGMWTSYNYLSVIQMTSSRPDILLDYQVS